MYNGMGGYGYGSGGGMQGQEMMIFVLCCVCCVCLLSLLGGWYSNIFCGVSTSLGKSCPVNTPVPEVQDTSNDTPGPATNNTVSNTCSEAYAKTFRGPKDPRPPIRPEACQGATRTIGRDCFYWEVQSDPTTGLARWMRKTDPEDANQQVKFSGACQPTVRCSNFIDPKTLERYSESDSQALLNQCVAVTPAANNENNAIKELTKQAKAVGATWIGTQAWNDTHSRVWYNQMLRFIGQKDLKVYLANSAKAAQTLKRKLGVNSIRKGTFASILEAAVRSPDNRADWIIDVVNKYYNQTLQGMQRTEQYFVSYLRRLIMRPPMKQWDAIIDNPRYY